MPIRVKVLNDAGDEEPGVVAKISKITPEGHELMRLDRRNGAEFVLNGPHEQIVVEYASPPPATESEGA